MRIDYAIDDREVVRAFRRAPQAMTRAVGSKVSRGAAEVARLARQLAPKAFSTLTQSIGSRMTAPLAAEVTAGMDYARMVEEGTGPGGTPPLQTLIDWIRVKGITPRGSGMDEDDLAFLIGRKIRRRGTPAQPYMGPALERRRSRVEQLIAEGVRDGLRRAGLA